MALRLLQLLVEDILAWLFFKFGTLFLPILGPLCASIGMCMSWYGANISTTIELLEAELSDGQILALTLLNVLVWFFSLLFHVCFFFDIHKKWNWVNSGVGLFAKSIIFIATTELSAVPSLLKTVDETCFILMIGLPLWAFGIEVTLTPSTDLSILSLNLAVSTSFAAAHVFDSDAAFGRRAVWMMVLQPLVYSFLYYLCMPRNKPIRLHLPRFSFSRTPITTHLMLNSVHRQPLEFGGDEFRLTFSNIGLPEGAALVRMTTEPLLWQEFCSLEYNQSAHEGQFIEEHKVENDLFLVQLESYEDPPLLRMQNWTANWYRVFVQQRQRRPPPPPPPPPPPQSPSTSPLHLDRPLRGRRIPRNYDTWTIRERGESSQAMS